MVSFLESIEVQIGKRKLKLKGDPELVNSSARKLNLTLESLSDGDNIKGETLLILAGLNLAEDNILIDKKHQDSLINLKNEIDDMTSYLLDTLSQD